MGPLDTPLRVVLESFALIDKAGGLKQLNQLTSTEVKARDDFNELKAAVDRAASAAVQAKASMRELVRRGKPIYGMVPGELIEVGRRLESQQYLLDRLRDLCSEISFADFLGPPEEWREMDHSPTQDVRDTIRAAVAFWDYTIEQDDPRRESDFDMYAALEVTAATWFTPDAWLANERKLKPILVEGQLEISPRLRPRLIQMYQSFLFGQWLACIALTRATLQYVLTAHASRWNITCIETGSNGQLHALSLEDLIDAFDAPEEIRQSMHYVRRTGNEVLHEAGDAAVLKYPQGRDMASSCMRHLSAAVRHVLRGPTH